MAILKNIILAISIYLKNNILKNVFLRYIIPVSLTLVLSGCYEEFTPDIDTKPVLCLNALITAGQPIEVHVSHTWLYSDYNQYQNHDVTDAVIGIFVNEEAKDIDYLPQEGDHIRLTADSPTYGHAEAQVTVPFSVPIKTVRCHPTLLSGWKKDNDYFSVEAEYTFNINIEVDINDTPLVDNFYRISYLGYHYNSSDSDSEKQGPLSNSRENYSKETKEGNDQSDGFWNVDFYTGTLEYDAEPIFGEHIGIFESIMGAEAYGFTFFTDRQFRGTTYPLHLNFINCNYRIVMRDLDPDKLDCGYIITLHTISKSYYEWSAYSWQKDNGFTSDLSDLGLSEPLWGYSNVSTGAGVVAAQSESTYTLNLKEYIETLLKSDI